MKAIWILVLIAAVMVVFRSYSDGSEVIGWAVAIGFLGLTKTYSVIDRL